LTLTCFVTLCDQVTQIGYPAALSDCIDALFEAKADNGSSLPTHVISIADTGSDEYSITLDGRLIAENLTISLLREALLEHVVHSLIVDLNSAVAMHGACVAWRDKSILIVGPSGSGKTNLAGWFTANGFEFLSDELFVLPGSGMTSTVRRPLLAKPGSEELVEIFKRSADKRILQAGPNIIIDPPRSLGQPMRQAGLLIFPNFTVGSSLAFEFVSPARAAMKLMECNLNSRNLADLGLPAVTKLASHVPALRLTYGSFSQLDEVADKFAKMIVENGLAISELKMMASVFQKTPATTPPSAPPSMKSVVPEETPRKAPKKLTIGMATYDDYDGVYFSVQAIRMFHPEALDDVEFLVIDNNPEGRCAAALKDLDKWIPNYRYVPKNHLSSTAIRNCVFEEAAGDIVLCMDCHVLLAPGALQKLLDYSDANPDSKDLLQGPLIYDDLTNISTHFEPEWRNGMFGTWATAPEGVDPDGAPFDIPMQGLGLFVCRRSAWPGFNPAFRGFGGEEGYIHEKFRQRGARVLCLPFLRWLHRFPRPLGVPYPIQWDDRIRNYHVGFREVGWDTAPIVEHFTELLGKHEKLEIVAERIARIATSADARDDKVVSLAPESENPHCREVFLPLLRKWIELSEEHGVCYSIFWGTLLGQLRNQRIIPYDDDVDVVVGKSGAKTLYALAGRVPGCVFNDELKGQPAWKDYEIRLVVRKDIISYYGPRFNHRGERIPTQEDSCAFNGPLARLIIKLPAGSYGREYWHLDVDLFTDVTRFNAYPAMHEVDELPDLEVRLLEGLQVSCLKDPLPYLVVFYGHDYMTPDHVYLEGQWVRRTSPDAAANKLQ
jgi:Glycosyl transferase family 2/LicD family